MIRLNLKVKTLEEVWEDDKKLLVGIPNLNLDGQLPPNNQTAYQLYNQKGERWLNPKDTIVLNEGIIGELLREIVPQVAAIWGARPEMPILEVLTKPRYLLRINDFEAKTIKEFGYGELLKAPPTMYISPSERRWFIPNRFLIRSQKSGRETIIDKPWDRDFLEEVLAEEVSHLIFRQLRREWGHEYVDAMLELGREGETKISMLNEVMAQYVKEKLAQSKPSLGLFVVNEKIASVWERIGEMETYRAIDALCSTYRLIDIAMADSVSLGKDEVRVDFFPEHPYNLEKQKAFNQGKISSQ